MMKIQDIDLTKFEKITENHYFGIMTFGEYISLIKNKENVGCSSETIINLAKLNAIEYNDDTDNNYVFVPPVNLFITEIGLVMFDSLNTLMILDLEERFMDNKLGVGIYNVSLDKAREIALQLR